MRETRIIDVQAAPLISEVRLVDLDPPTVFVKLDTLMADVSSVELNGIATPNFIFSPGTNSVLVEISINTELRDIRVLGTPRSLDGAYVTFKLQGSRQVMGTERLLQRISRLSQTKAGSILGHPETHGYVDLMSCDSSGHQTLIIHTFRVIQELVQRSQAKDVFVFPSERLVGIQVLGLLEIPGGGYKVVLQIVTGDGTLVRLLSWEAPVAQ